MIADGLVAVRVRHIQDAWDMKKLLLGGADSLTGETEPHSSGAKPQCGSNEEKRMGRAFRKLQKGDGAWASGGPGL